MVGVFIGRTVSHCEETGSSSRNAQAQEGGNENGRQAPGAGGERMCVSVPFLPPSSFHPYPRMRCEVVVCRHVFHASQLQ